MGEMRVGDVRMERCCSVGVVAERGTTAVGHGGAQLFVSLNVRKLNVFILRTTCTHRVRSHSDPRH